MLAYVFWHWPNIDIAYDSYRGLLERFHETLNANKPHGFLMSVVFASSNLPWQPSSQPAFEDWYLVDDSAALDVLNQAAVSGACEEAHNLVARQAAGGTAGLYRLRAGYEALTKARQATWFSKPANVSYRDFYSTIEPTASLPDVGLWQMQMTLGPTTEFAIYSSDTVPQTNTAPSCKVELQLAWPK